MDLTDNNSQQQLEPDEPLNEFAQGILNQIPEADRSVVQKYIKQWDGGVTQHLQKIHEQYAPYKELGDIEALQNSLYYTSMLQNDPQGFIKTVTEAMKEAGMSLDDFEPEVEQQQGSGAFEIPKEFTSRIDTMEKMLGSMYEQFQGYTSSQQEEAQIAQLDKLLTDMHSRHGEFDDEWVLLQIERGKDPEEAVKLFQKNIVEKYGSPRKQAPTLLSANGAVKQDQVVPSKLNPDQRKQWALQALLANQDT